MNGRMMERMASLPSNSSVSNKLRCHDKRVANPVPVSLAAVLRLSHTQERSSKQNAALLVPGRGVLRWTELPAAVPEAGTWLDPADPRVPPWLTVFDGEVLVALDAGGGYLGGAGRKRHDPQGHEVSVGVEPAARGRGLARGLVVRLAHRILADGAIPTYLHDAQNGPSCRVAEAAGFPDRGWRAMALWKAGGTR